MNMNKTNNLSEVDSQMNTAQQQTRDGIFMRNVSLSYSQNEDNILNGVDMFVKKGDIYGLLGPSGCGKTTLIRCALGLRKPDFGDVKIFNQKPGSSWLSVPGCNVGYMPQELALYEDLTIYEMLTYVGRIFRMKNNILHLKIVEMAELLLLPEPDRYIRTLSGGQQRRVSFAATIIHKPPLLILDEPTAGVDPLLREKIWTHMMKMAKMEKVTILITTHYIEEARRANKIGFMRKGRILCEGVPKELMEKFNVHTLEQVFLTLSEKKRKSTIITPNEMIQFKKAYQLEKQLDESIQQVPNLPLKILRKLSFTIPLVNQELKAVVKFSQNECRIEPMNDIKLEDEIENHSPNIVQSMNVWLQVFFAILLKNLAQDLRNPLNLSFQYISPIGQILLFALCVGKAPQLIPIGVYNQEFSFLNFTNHFLNEVNTNRVHLIKYESEAKAMQDAKMGKLWGVLTFPKLYSHAFVERNAYNVSNKTIAHSTITLRADFANRIVADLTYNSLTTSYHRFMEKQIKEFMVQSKFSDTYISYSLPPIYGHENDENDQAQRDFMLPGMIINLGFAMAIALSSLTLIKERSGQTLERNYVCGVSSSQMLLAHATCRLFLNIPFAILILLLPVLLFHFPYEGSLLTGLAIILLQSINGMALGILVASLSKSLIMAMVCTSGAFMICLFSSSTLWPLEAVPNRIRWLCYLLPTTLATESLRSVALRGWELEHYQVWTSFALVGTWSLLLMMIGIRFFKLNQ